MLGKWNDSYLTMRIRKFAAPVWLLVFAAYLLISLAMTYPVVTQLTSHLAGVDGNDSLEFAWSMWWFKHALLDLGTSPIEISVLNYPDGIRFPLLPSMSQSFLLGLPFTALASPVLAFNLIFLLSFPLCGLSGYWLCADLTGNRRAAFLGGLIWAFFPNKGGHALAGHLFQLVVFTLPLAAMFLLRQVRQPSLRNGALAGVMLAVAASVHPVNVAYFLLPLLIVVVGAQVWQAWRESRWHGVAQVAKHIAPTAVVGGVLATPLFLPTVLDTVGGELNFLVERGTVGFSTDLLAFLLPAPANPIVLLTPLATLADTAVLSEFEGIAYVGLVPLTLAVLAARWRWAESKVWVALGGLAAVLSLGPLLIANGGLVRVPVETETYPVLMPYAFIGQLPFFQWSRTPSRLNETVLFAVMLLAALGATEWLARLKPARAWAMWIAACLIIPLEFMVQFPTPTTAVEPPPQLAALADDHSFTAVLNTPVPNNTVNLNTLLQQTFHQHPMIGGRVYRDVPRGNATQRFFDLMLLASDSFDIAATPSADQKVATLSHFDIGRVLYQPAGDPSGATRTALESLLGEPVIDTPSVAVYAVPQTAATQSHYFIFGENWHAPQAFGDSPARWFNDTATLYIFSDRPQTGSLAFTAIPGRDLRRLLIRHNGGQVAWFGVGDWANLQTPPFTLTAGLNRIDFADEDGHWQFVGDPRCMGGSAVAGVYPMSVPCDAADSASAKYSLAIRDIRFEEVAPPTAIAVFDNRFELLEAALPPTAAPGSAIALNLKWRAAQFGDGDWTLFVHLLDADGVWVAGSDSAPARGQYPTSRWRSGEVVAQNVSLVLPAQVSPGDYSVVVGWYEWPSLERLPLPTGADSLVVGQVQIP